MCTPGDDDSFHDLHVRGLPPVISRARLATGASQKLAASKQEVQAFAARLERALGEPVHLHIACEACTTEDEEALDALAHFVAARNPALL